MFRIKFADDPNTPVEIEEGFYNLTDGGVLTVHDERFDGRRVYSPNAWVSIEDLN